MKKLAMALAIMVMVGVNSAAAEMVDIGSGQMEQAEFASLKAMVQGRPTAKGPAISTPLAHPEPYGMVEMTRADFETLRDKVAGLGVGVAGRPAVKAVQMVNIGTGEMPRDEFIALKHMVEGGDVIELDYLAAFQP